MQLIAYLWISIVFTRCRVPRISLPLLVLLGVVQPSGSDINGGLPVDKKVCQGTSLGLTHQGDKWTQERYDALYRRYSNCTHVDGNLELVFITDPSPDLSFLSAIKEITGYVLITACYVDNIPLTSLRVIRGRTLYHDSEGGQSHFYSLYVYLNFDPDNPLEVGLKGLQLNSLHEIQSGSILIQHNNRMCHVNSVYWKDIVTGESSIISTNEIHDTNHPHVKCQECHPACEHNGTKYCWGSGPENCQKLNRVTCSSQCGGQCFGSLPNQCCDSECIGGCVGPMKNQCWACKNFDNNGMCEKFCPPEFVYDPGQFKQVANPYFKYSYGTLCVDKCPDHLNSRQGACVQDCGKGMVADRERKCVECNGTCPKDCKFDYPRVTSQNIKSLKDCTIIQGSINILDLSFQEDKFYNIAPLNISDLTYLKDVREVTGYVKIQANNPQFRDLSFLRNLHIIHGRTLDSIQTSLHVFKTSLEVLGLDSLKEIRNGAVLVKSNARLCYASSINWEHLLVKKAVVLENRNSRDCAADNEVCHPECLENGCWGPNDDQCMSCKNFYFDDGNKGSNKRCVSSCYAQPGMFESGLRQCNPCHEECSSNCSGPGADQCDSCKTARDGPYCVSQCPTTKYLDEHGVCRECHPNCDEDGCTGPLDNQHPKGCRSCKLPLYDWRDGRTPSSSSQSNVTECLSPDSECPNGYFKKLLKAACIKCHPLCLECEGPSVDECIICQYHRQGKKCVAKCPSDHYHSKRVVNPGSPISPNYTLPSGNISIDPHISIMMEPTCEQCDPNCLKCIGPTNKRCTVCKQYKVFVDDQPGYNTSHEFYCTEKCPDDKPESKVNNTETICYPIDIAAQRGMIASIIIGIVVAILIVTVVTCVLCLKRKKANEAIKSAKESMSKANTKEDLPLMKISDPSKKPDMSSLLIVKTSELTLGAPIGSGAYGEVCKGLWRPEDPKWGPGPHRVAIKILKENNKELLDEARIMASVKHPCCVSVLCVSLSAKLMLVTPLMELGCMLDYIRKNASIITSKDIILWSQQIAMGMQHLESRGIVHCDLAARNVLVAKVNQVKITDFGLAKIHFWKELQGMSNETDLATKMPVKWLAIESLKTREFTHKSDVWSYGVTIWELCTFGDRPYKQLLNYREILGILEAGDRLERPAVCFFEFYSVLLDCWCGNPERRPNFSDLVLSMSDMLQEPHKYLHIKPEHRHPPIEIHHQQHNNNNNNMRTNNFRHNNHSTVDQQANLPLDYLTPQLHEPPILYSNLLLLKEHLTPSTQPHQPEYANEAWNGEQEDASQLSDLKYIPTLSDFSHNYSNDFAPGFLDRPIRSPNPNHSSMSNGDSSYVPHDENPLLHKFLANGMAQHPSDFESDLHVSDFDPRQNQSDHNYYNELDF